MGRNFLRARPTSNKVYKDKSGAKPEPEPLQTGQWYGHQLALGAWDRPQSYNVDILLTILVTHSSAGQQCMALVPLPVSLSAPSLLEPQLLLVRNAIASPSNHRETRSEASQVERYLDRVGKEGDSKGVYMLLLSSSPSCPYLGAPGLLLASSAGWAQCYTLL